MFLINVLCKPVPKRRAASFLKGAQNYLDRFFAEHSSLSVLSYLVLIPVYGPPINTWNTPCIHIAVLEVNPSSKKLHSDAALFVPSVLCRCNMSMPQKA